MRIQILPPTNLNRRGADFENHLRGWQGGREIYTTFSTQGGFRGPHQKPHKYFSINVQNTFPQQEFVRSLYDKKKQLYGSAEKEQNLS
jgi:hypothetical protein